jgi:anti-sigma B factor antagonist
MAITTQTYGDTGVLRLSGRFDAHVAPEVKGLLERSDAPARMVVDLSAVTFIDSTALAALVRGMKNCRQKSGDLRLCGLQQSVRIIFELTRLDRAFEILPNEDAAISSFA